MIEEKFIELFKKNRRDIDKNSIDGMNKRRDEAFEFFKNNGFPTSKDEDYKHSDIARLFDTDSRLNLSEETHSFELADIFKFDVPKLSTHVHFFVNNFYSDKSGEDNTLPQGVFVGSMAKFARRYPQKFDQYYARIADTRRAGIAAYNTMFAQDGFVVYVPEKVVIEKPIQLINILRSDENLNVNRRNLIIAEKDALVKILACDCTRSNRHFVVTQVTEIFARENARVDFYELEENSENVSRLSSLFSNQKRDSNVMVNSITLHNGFTRNDFHVRLLDHHAEAFVAGLAICDKNQHIDNFAFLDHAQPHCTSNELFKHVLQERASGAFCGKILVEKDAQKTQAYQTNRNLCTSREARMYAKPQLEIYADDVKCSHGLTTGQLDEDALFYMQARGISKADAKMLLMLAFTQDIIDLISVDELKERLLHIIDKRFRGNFSLPRNNE